jgi:anti-anti-sigma regulatory factor
MNFKIDTKEKFFIIAPIFTDLTVNMADSIVNEVIAISKNKPNNVIINMKNINTIEIEAAQKFAELRTFMYNQNFSFVVCCFSHIIMEQITTWELDEAINITPTESEAWDIVQMDEIERDFMNYNELE